MHNRNRPKVVHIELIDPWTKEFCAGASLQYTPERAARGHYSKSIARLRVAAKNWTGLRTPALRLRLQYV